MSKPLQAVRGMNDLLPDETPLWRYAEAVIRRVMDSYGYAEIRTPVVEMTQLFRRGMGENTDVVEKEMYTFADRNGDSLTLRPEFTAGIVRAGIEHGLFYNQVQRLWSAGPVFRHERPQKGRYRQFHQLSIEIAGMAGVEADAELILINARLFRELGLAGAVTLELNTLGSAEDRATYRTALVEYLRRYENELDADSKRRLALNPLRILDSKDPATREIVRNAPVIHDYLSAPAARAFAGLREILERNHIAYTVNPHLVRGLDYYCNTVFEWTTTALGAQGTVSAGGRYDPLIALLGGRAVPACGCAPGLERIILLLKETGCREAVSSESDVVLVCEESVTAKALYLCEKIRDMLPGVSVRGSTGGSFKSKMKRAGRSRACIALVIGEQEADADRVSVKYLHEDRAQASVSVQEASVLIREALARRKAPEHPEPV